jgi:hypothetical protein
MRAPQPHNIALLHTYVHLSFKPHLFAAGQPFVVVDVTASPDATVVINGVNGASSNITLSTASETTIEISLISTDFSCPNGLNYSINALQGSLLPTL